MDADQLKAVVALKAGLIEAMSWNARTLMSHMEVHGAITIKERQTITNTSANDTEVATNLLTTLQGHCNGFDQLISMLMANQLSNWADKLKSKLEQVQREASATTATPCTVPAQSANSGEAGNNVSLCISAMLSNSNKFM